MVLDDEKEEMKNCFNIKKWFLHECAKNNGNWEELMFYRILKSQLTIYLQSTAGK